MKKSVMGAVALAVPALLAACTTNPYTGETQSSKTARNAVIGAAGGAIIGAVIGNNTGGGNATKGAILGATSGGLTGGAIGVYQDRQEARLRQELAATGVGVRRDGDNITLIMPGNITFATDRADIRTDFFAVLNSVGRVLREYDMTMVLVQGHTDSTGSDAYNDQLSVRRAESVANYLAAQGINPGRFEAIGYGERQPVADNATAEGRQQNRRVEIQLVPIRA